MSTSWLRLTLAAIVMGVSALCLFSISLLPTVGWGDSADLATRMVSDTGQLTGDTHRDYQLYRMVGKVFQLLPIEDAAAKANFMSAFFGASTVFFVVFMTGALTQSLFAGAVAGIALTVSHTFWLLSVMTEVSTFHTALIYGFYASAAAWWRTRQNLLLIAMALCAGLALSHNSSSLLLPITMLPLLILAFRTIKPLALCIGTVAFLVASLPYWTDVVSRLGEDSGFRTVLGLALPQHPFREVARLHEAAMFLAYLTYNFFGLGVVFGAIGAWRGAVSRNLPLVPPAAWAAIIVYAGISSSFPDKFNIYVLAYPFFAVLVGIGAAHIIERYPSRSVMALQVISIAFLPPACYLGTILAGDLLRVDLIGARPAPMRDNAWYFLWPPKTGYRGPREFAEAALGSVEERSVLIADYTLWAPMNFLQVVEGLREDVELRTSDELSEVGLASFIESIGCERPVYLAAISPAAYYQLDEIREKFSIVPIASSYKVDRGCAAAQQEN